MRLKLIATLFICVIAFSSCEEENHGIRFTDPPAPLKDTSYIISNYGTSVYKKILLEDLTGVRCVNCPRAAAKAAELKGKFGDTLVVVGLYLKALPQFTAPWSGYPDLRTDDAEAIANTVGTPNGLPSGYIDRYKFGTQAPLSDNQWEGYIPQRKGISPVKIWLDYEANTNEELVLKTKLTYTEDQSSAQHKLALYITENDIISKQSTIPPQGYIEDYSHQHVLRTAVTLPLGQLLTEPLEAGRVFEKDFKFNWNPEWNRNKSYLVAVVINAMDESVVQVEEISLY